MELCLFLDYDGTLAPIVKDPWKAVLPEETRRVVKGIAQTPGVRVVIISGRALADIKKRVGLKRVIYVGNHGFEMQGPGISFKFPLTGRTKADLAALLKELKQDLAGMKGVLIENKGVTVSIHYRNAPPGQIRKIHSLIAARTATYVAAARIRVNRGKKVFELLPPVEWHKGMAVRFIMESLAGARGARSVRWLPVYIGDDTTDENAFKTIGKKGVTVVVGKKRDTHAQYCVRNTGEVLHLLKVLKESVI